MIQPWDRSVLGAIEKAIQKSDIGLVPNVDGTVVRLNIPPLTEERRKDLVKVVHKRMEEARVEIRNLRRDAARRPQEGRARRDRRCRRVASPARGAPEDDRPLHRRGRPPRRREGTGGPRGLVAGSPLARPTDAPPTGARRRPGDRSRRRPRPSPRRRRPARGAAPRRHGPAAPRRDHHGRQPPLGAPARPARARGPRRRRRGDPDPPAHAVRRGVPVVTLYAFSRENWARSDDEVRGLFGLLEQAIRSETAELRDAGRPDPPPRPARRAAGRHPALDRRGARGDRRRRPASSSTSRSTTPAGRSSSTRSGGSRRAASPRRRSTRTTISGGAVHGRPARTRTS